MCAHAHHGRLKRDLHAVGRDCDAYRLGCRAARARAPRPPRLLRRPKALHRKRGAQQWVNRVKRKLEERCIVVDRGDRRLVQQHRRGGGAATAVQLNLAAQVVGIHLEPADGGSGGGGQETSGMARAKSHGKRMGKTTWAAHGQNHVGSA
eukprot:365233-Chlamydomonas_euryale.AAC.11